MTENLRDAIKEARERDQSLSPAELRDGWAGVEKRAGNPKALTVWVLGGAVTAIAMLLAGFLAFRTPAAIDLARDQKQCAAVDARHIATNASCAEVRAHIDTDEVQLARATVVEREAKNRLKVVRGRVRFSVTRRMTATDRLEIHVRGGTIIVVGTAFTVEQSDSEGSVRLEHGTIRFVWDDHEEQVLAPGESLSWPRRKPTPEPAQTPAPVPEAPPEQQPGKHPRVDTKLEANVEQVMQRQFQLRAQRRYPEAMDVLRGAASDKAYTKNQRERFDYELGVLIQNHEPSKACAHWKHHRDAFQSRRADVLKALEGCQ